MILSIFVPGIPKNANAKSQWARFAKANENRKFRLLAAAAAYEAVGRQDWTATDFTTITARHVSPVMRRRDPLGLAERLKGVMDGLVDAAIIPDDDETHIAVRLARSVRGPVAGIQLTITQEPPA